MLRWIPVDLKLVASLALGILQRPWPERAGGYDQPGGVV